MERKTKSDVMPISVTHSYVGLGIPFVFHWKLFTFCGHFSIPTIVEDTYQKKPKKETELVIHLHLSILILLGF